MKLRNFSPIVISLLVGAALGYCLGPASSPAPAPEPEQKAEPEQVKQPEYRGERADRALRARIKELEGMLAKQGIEVEKMKEESSRRDRPRDFRADMERLKKEEPERYAQITNSMAQFRRHRLERAQSKIDFLSSIDTSRMSPAMLKVHSDLQDMIEKREAVEEKMRGFMDMTEEERREAFQEIGEIDGRIQDTRAQQGGARQSSRPDGGGAGIPGRRRCRDNRHGQEHLRGDRLRLGFRRAGRARQARRSRRTRRSRWKGREPLT